MDKPQGPNVKKLIIHKMSYLMIPPGTKEGDGLVTGLAALSKPGNIEAVAREATEWVEKSIALVRTATGGPYPVDDEFVAGVILRAIDAQKARQLKVSKEREMTVTTCAVYWYRSEGGEILGGVEQVDGDSEDLSKAVTRRFEDPCKSFLLGMNILPTIEVAQEFLSRLKGQLAKLEIEKERYLEKINDQIKKKETLIRSLQKTIQSF